MTRPIEEGATARTPEELCAQVERTRRELGVTVAALAAKSDVRARARAKAARGLGLARDHRGVLVTAAAVTGAGWLLWRRKG